MAIGIYPPYYMHGREGIVISLGHHWIFSVPTIGIVDSGLLITHWLGILIVSGLAFLLLKTPNR